MNAFAQFPQKVFFPKPLIFTADDIPKVRNFHTPGLQICFITWEGDLGVLEGSPLKRWALS